GAPDREAEDVAQEVFAAFHRAVVEDRRRSENPWPYLREATIRIAVDVVRTLRRQGDLTEFEEGVFEPMDDHVDADVEHGAAVREELAVGLRLLDGLELDRRVVYVLKEMEGMTLAEIAATVGISPNTAATRLRL